MAGAITELYGHPLYACLHFASAAECNSVFGARIAGGGDFLGGETYVSFGRTAELSQSGRFIRLPVDQQLLPHDLHMTRRIDANPSLIPARDAVQFNADWLHTIDMADKENPRRSTKEGRVA